MYTYIYSHTKVHAIYIHIYSNKNIYIRIHERIHTDIHSKIRRSYIHVDLYINMHTYRVMMQIRTCTCINSNMRPYIYTYIQKDDATNHPVTPVFI